MPDPAAHAAHLADAPKCVSPVIASFLRVWSNDLPDAALDRLLRPLMPAIAGTRSTPALEQRRAMLAVDWLIRECTPAWLRVAEMPEHADALAGLPEFVGVESVEDVQLALDAAVIAAETSWQTQDNAGAADWDEVTFAVNTVAMHSAAEAVLAVVAEADMDPAWEDALSAAEAAVHAAAWVASRRICRAYAPSVLAALRPTIEALQKSAQQLILRMCAVA